MWGAGNFYDRKAMPDGERDFANHEIGVRCDDCGADDTVFGIANNLDETVRGASDFAPWSIREWDDSFFVVVAFGLKVGFAEAD